MNIKTFLAFKNSKEWIEFEEYYKDFSINSQLGLFRYEDANTNFLKSLLDENNIYGYGTYPMHCFLELLALRSKKDDFFNTNTNVTDINELKIECRKTKIVSGVPDMFITYNAKNDSKENKYAILLEAKLQSEETSEDQCQSYWNDLENNPKYKSKYDEYNRKYVYLTLDGKSGTGKDNYIDISYQDLIDYVYTPCTFKKSNSNVTLTIEEYIKSFNSLYKEEIFSIDKIPLSYKAKKLTMNIWNKYSETLIEMINDVNKYFVYLYESNGDIVKILLANIYKLDEQLTPKLDSNIKQKINNTAKPNRILLDGVEYGSYSNAEFYYQVFKLLIEKLNIKDVNDLKEINYWSDKYKYIYSGEEYKTLKSYEKCYSSNRYGELTINNKNYYYYTASELEDVNAFINNLDVNTFIDNFKKRYPTVNINITIKLERNKFLDMLKQKK